MNMKIIEAVTKTLVGVVVLFGGILLFTVLFQGVLHIEGAGMYATPLAFVLSAFAMYRFAEKTKSWKLGFYDVHRTRNLLLGALVGLLLVGASVLMMGVDGQIEITGNAIHQNSILMQILLFALVAFGEELFFRGYLYGMYEKLFSSRVAIIATSLLFSAVHLMNPDAFSRPPLFIALEIVNIFLLAVLLGLTRYYSKSIWFPIALHFVINFVQSAVFGFVNGGKETPSLLSIVYHEPTVWNGAGYGFESSLATAIVLVVILIILKVMRKLKIGGTANFFGYSQ